MEAGKPPELEQLMSLLGEYGATGRDPTADGIPADLQVPPTALPRRFPPPSPARRQHSQDGGTVYEIVENRLEARRSACCE